MWGGGIHATCGHLSPSHVNDSKTVDKCVAGVPAHGGEDDAGGRHAMEERQLSRRHSARQDGRHGASRRRRQGLRQGHEVSLGQQEDGVL